MSGKLVGIGIVGLALVAGIAMYVLQIFAYYDEVELNEIRLISVASGAPDPILARDIQVIDASSSPLRFRACFTTDNSLAMLTENYEVIDHAVPLVAPGWFDCFDAQAVGAALEQGRAVGFMAQPEIRDGVDRVVAIFEDGRGFAWHQLNEKYQD